jgi:hypothetical protein
MNPTISTLLNTFHTIDPIKNIYHNSKDFYLTNSQKSIFEGTTLKTNLIDIINLDN